MSGTVELLQELEEAQGGLVDNGELEEGSVDTRGDEIRGAADDAGEVAVVGDPGRATDPTTDAGDAGG